MNVESDRPAAGRLLRVLRRVNLAFAVLAALPPLAHVLEMPNKLGLDSELWLAVQQHLYRGWGPFFGGPVEIIALVTTVALLVARRRSAYTGEVDTGSPIRICANQRSTAPMRLTLVAALAYAGMIAVFFVFNDPVNAALNGWTPATIPPDWKSFRLRWEIGHALAAILSLVAITTLVRAWMNERDHRTARERISGPS